ncbi:MAG TPA: YncE family protein [Gemmatimonadales bacterium]|nr:YncE family protein [Gemmatimonadales bacterium]
MSTCGTPFEPTTALAAQRLALPGGPLGITIASAGVAYVTLDQSASVAPVDVTVPAATTTIPVGNVPSYVASNPAGSRVYVANQLSDNVGIINTSTNVQSPVIAVHGDPLPVAVSTDGATLFTTTNANYLWKIDLATNTVIDSLLLTATSHHLLVHPNGTLLYVATRDGGSVLEVSWPTMQIVRTFTLGGRTQGMAISCDQQELYVANETSNVLHVINLKAGTLVTSIPLASGGEGLALNSDGTKLYVGLVSGGAVQVINRVQRTVLTTINTGRHAAGNRGRRAAAADDRRQRGGMAGFSPLVLWTDCEVSTSEARHEASRCGSHSLHRRDRELSESQQPNRPDRQHRRRGERHHCSGRHLHPARRIGAVSHRRAESWRSGDRWNSAVLEIQRQHDTHR